MYDAGRGRGRGRARGRADAGELDEPPPEDDLNGMDHLSIPLFTVSHVIVLQAKM